MLPRSRPLAALLIASGALLPLAAKAQDSARAAQAPPGRVVYRISPSAADPAVTRFTESNVVLFNRSSGDHAQLALFLPGTHGQPENAMLLMSVVANLGYRVIGLEYNDVPAVDQICQPNPDPACAGAVREKRIFGDDATRLIDDTPAESINTRLIRLLQYLDAHHPQEHWDSYLLDGQPNWSRIVVSGLSQGAGMAAYIAKRRQVARAVLFSSPWDFSAPARQFSSWLKQDSATPPDRWFAEYHEREKTARTIARAYALLHIPQDHIRVFNLDLPANFHGSSPNPYHGTTIKLPGYIPQWQFLFGQAPPS